MLALASALIESGEVGEVVTVAYQPWLRSNASV